MKRVFCQRAESFVFQEICAVCLLTASKLEETPKKMKEFLNVFKQLEAVVDTEHFDLDVKLSL